MGCESVSDFAGLFKVSDYESAIETSILQKVDSLKDNMVQLSRLRTAWKLSVAEFEVALKRKAEGLHTEDLDAPLDAITKSSADADFEGAYHFK
eukprot:5315925-Karenia_brevis.AAC.1